MKGLCLKICTMKVGTHNVALIYAFLGVFERKENKETLPFQFMENGVNKSKSTNLGEAFPSYIRTSNSKNKSRGMDADTSLDTTINKTNRIQSTSGITPLPNISYFLLFFVCFR